MSTDIHTYDRDGPDARYVEDYADINSWNKKYKTLINGSILNILLSVVLASQLLSCSTDKVTPVAQTEASPEESVGPVGAANSAPVASGVSITGVAKVGQTLTGNHTYSDADIVH